MSPIRSLLTAAALVLAAPLAAQAAPIQAGPIQAAPIPPGPLDPTVPAFEGRPVEDRPLPALDVPQHPFMAPTGSNSMHNGAYATDAYAGGGPRGQDLSVTSESYGVE